MSSGAVFLSTPRITYSVSPAVESERCLCCSAITHTLPSHHNHLLCLKEKAEKHIICALYTPASAFILHCFLSWNDFIIIIRYFCEFKTHYPYPLVQQNSTIITSVRVMGSLFPQMSLFWVSALTVRIHTAEISHVTLAFREELDEGWHAAFLWGVVFFARSNPCICISLASQLEWMCPNHSLLI